VEKDYSKLLNIWFYLILFIFPFLGGLVGFRLRSHKPEYIKLFIAFSGAFLFSITVISLIPELYHHEIKTSYGYFILIGFFLQIVIDIFSGGIEHGHMHKHMDGTSTKIFIALALHAFLEGMAGGSGIFRDEVQHNILFGIAMHEIPAAFALMVVLKSDSKQKGLMYFWLTAYALMTPVGALVAQTSVQSYEIIGEYMPYLVASVIGVFLHISTTILFENSDNHRFSVYKVIAVLIGASVAIISTNLHIH